MEVTLHSKSQQPINLSYQALSALIQALPDNPNYQAFYSEQANHPSSEVRSAIAAKEHLTEAAIHQLAKDSSSAVLDQLVYNPSAQAQLNPVDLEGIFARSVEAAKIVTYTLDRWNDQKSIVELLLQHPDPMIRYALAQDSNLAKPLLAKLLKDPDSAVVDAANRTLAR